ncbi:MAG: glycosyltransferase family 2 protein [Candidatus Omnitrophica bacterium]|nr:glycosyltransferase family 2 protein [Candidatus Omnitrophota bacterium]
MYKDKKVSLILPCYNEEQGLEYILSNRPLFFDEVIVVDNNSSDSSADIARRHNASVCFLSKRGYGRACRKGLEKASGDIVLMMDSDASYPVDESGKLIEELAEKKCDFISGCRFPLNNKRAMPWIKRKSNRFFSSLIRFLFSIGLKDSQSGMIAFRKDILNEILPDNYDMEFGMRLKLQAWVNPNIRCYEAHINYRSRIGRVKYRSIIDGAKTVLDMFLFYFTFRKRIFKYQIN